MTNRELLNLLKDLETKHLEMLDDEVRILFMESDFETTIKEASIRTEKLNEDFNFVKMDKPDFAIVVDC